MDVKKLAKPYTPTEGAFKDVTFWMSPYRRLAWDNTVRDLERITPQAEYRNSVTGDVTNEEPAQLATARKQARKRNKALKTDWVQTRLWRTEHDTFVSPLSSLMALDLPDDPTTEAAAFDAFWRETFPDTKAKWDAFIQILGTATANVLWEAFGATRESVAPAPKELSDDGDGEADETPLEGESGSSADEMSSEPTTTS